MVEGHDGPENGNVTLLEFIHFLETHPSDRSRKPAKFESTALIVLNTPIASLEYFERLRAHCAFVLCADGGANRLHDLITSHYKSPEQHQLRGQRLADLRPDAIHGDLDSVRDDVRKTYEAIGVEISRDPDQYSTDFGKAIAKVRSILPGVSDILVLGSLGGRVDQGIGLLHELLREQKYNHPDVQFWIFTEASVTVLLWSGKSIIKTPLRSGLIERNVGILPLYGKATISLRGFEWDVSNWPTELGKQVSTSNHIVSDELEITTDREVLFTVERKLV